MNNCCEHGSDHNQNELEKLGPYQQFSADATWPSMLPNKWLLGNVSGIAVDKEDNVWILQRPKSLTSDELLLGTAAPPVIQFGPDGRVARAWGGKSVCNKYTWPGREHSIFVDHKDFVWISGNGEYDGHILKFTQAGEFVMQIGFYGPRTSNADETRMASPAGLEVDPETNLLYVADGYHNHRIIVYDGETGECKYKWGAYGNQPIDTVTSVPLSLPSAPVIGKMPQFALAHSVRISRDGKVYVCDRLNNRIQVFSKYGKFIEEFFIRSETAGFGSISDLVFSLDDEQKFMYGVDITNCCGYKLERSTGKILQVFGALGRYAGQFVQPHGIAIDSKENLYICEVSNGNRAQKFKLL